MPNPGVKVTYKLSGGATRTGVVLVDVDEAHVLVSDDTRNTTQRVLARSELTTDGPIPDPPPDPDPDPPPAGTATLYVAPGGSDGNAGTSATLALASFAAAYAKANAGDVVEVAAGNYSAQTLRRDTAKDGFVAPVVFRANGLVQLPGLNFGQDYDDPGAWHVEIHGVRVNGWVDLRRTVDTVFRDVRLDGVFAAGARQVEFHGGEWGVNHPNTGTHPEFTAYNRPGNLVLPDGLLLDGVEVHHIGRPAGAEHVHTNAFHPQAGSNIVVRNCHFHHNDVFSILVNPDHEIRGLTLENNVFEPSTNTNFTGQAFYSVHIDARSVPVHDVRIRGNRFDQQFLQQGQVEVVEACGNTGEVPVSWQAACP